LCLRWPWAVHLYFFVIDDMTSFDVCWLCGRGNIFSKEPLDQRLGILTAVFQRLH
jgi:hypothetical protein